MAEAFIGEIRLFGGTRAPLNWAFCDGQLLKIADYNQLFSLIGKTYGGDGITTFGVPDLQGRAVVGYGQGTGLSNNYALGQAEGAFTVTLTQTEMPAHTHALTASTQTATSVTPDNNALATMPTGFSGFVAQNTDGLITAHLNEAVVVGNGSEDATHSNSMPSISMNYIIALRGTYPIFD